MLGGIGKNIGRVAAALSPIDLFSMQQVSKLRSSTKGFQGFMQGMGDTITNNMNGLKRNLHQYGDNADNGTLSRYMGGYKIGENRLDLDKSTQQFRSMVRKRAMMGAGAYAGASLMFGNDSIVPSTVNTAAQVGFHGGAAYGLSKFVHPMAGLAYGGLGVFNASRPGNNVGPF